MCGGWGIHVPIATANELWMERMIFYVGTCDEQMIMATCCDPCVYFPR